MTTYQYQLRQVVDIDTAADDETNTGVSVHTQWDQSQLLVVSMMLQAKVVQQDQMLKLLC